MKQFLLIIAAAFAAFFISGCASFGTGPLATATHNDLVAAAALATANGYPARAAVRLAIDAQLTACEQAIAAAAPKAPAITGAVGPITAAEMLEEAVGSFTGIPATVKINCSPIPVVIFPGM